MLTLPQDASDPSRSALADLKRNNEWLVIDALRGSGPQARAELAHITGLSRSTIGNVVRALQQRGVVIEGEHAGSVHSLTGRPARAVTMSPDAGAVVGVAINRARLRVAVAGLAGSIRAEWHEPIGDEATADVILARAAELTRAGLEQEGLGISRLAGVGLGIPGPVDVAFGGVDARSTLRRWAGVDARDQLSRQLGGVAVFPDNDANYCALGEHHHGAARASRTLLHLTIGAGIGGGIVIDGRLHRGHDGYAGEIGHTIVTPDGALCRSCGRRGCLSTVATSDALLGALEVSSGRSTTLPELLELDARGDVVAQSTLRQAGAHIGRVSSVIVDMFNPESLVLGGELGSGSRSLLAGVREAVAAYAQPIINGLRVVPGELDDRADVLGAIARVRRDDDLLRAFLLSA